MGAFQAKYSQDQKRAVEHAYCDACIRPVSAIARLAKAGELPYNGVPLEPFDISAGYAYEIGRREEKRRAGRLRTELANMPAQDAMEELRRRILSMLDHETARYLRAQKAGKPHDLEKLRRLIRAARELASLPGPTATERAKAVGTGESKNTENRAHRGTGVGGDILRAMRSGAIGDPAQDEPIPSDVRINVGDAAINGDGEPPSEGSEDGGDEAPGSQERGEVARLHAQSLDVV